MNTITICKFDVLDAELLSTVEGGYSGKDCLKDMGGYALAGAGSGALWGAPAGGVLEHFQVHLSELMLGQLQEALHVWVE